jgi:hypothetical protein
VKKGIVVVGGVTFELRNCRYPLSAIPLLIFQEIANSLRIGGIERHDFAGRISRTCNLDPEKVGFPGIIHCRRFAEISEIHLYEDAEQEELILEIIAGVPAGSYWVPSKGDYSQEQIKVESYAGSGSPAVGLVSEIEEGIKAILQARAAACG